MKHVRETSPPGLTLLVTEGLMDKLGCRTEVLGHVEGGFVISLYTIVLDVHVSVVISTSKHIVPLPLCCIQDVCNTQIPQARPLQSRLPVSHTQYEAVIMDFDTAGRFKGCMHLLTHPR